MERNDNIYLLENFTFGNTISIEQLSRDYPNLIFERITPTIYTIQVPEGQEAELERLRGELKLVITPVIYGLNAQQALEISNISTLHDYPYGALRGTGVLIGFVDTGIEYTNPLFQNADGTTRIKALWDQTIPGNPPNDFRYGSVYTPEMINAALRSPDPYSVVPSRDENGHGTFLAGIAAGNDQTDVASFVGGAPDAGIMMVKLRPASQALRKYYFVNETIPAFQNNDIMTGISFLLNQAYNLNAPLVLCIGLGNNFGAHNGTEIMERYLQGISSATEVIVVIAVGNEGNTGHHYKGVLNNGLSEEVEVNVGEGETGFLMNLWAALPNRIQVAVRSPLGQIIDKVPIINDQIQTYKFKLEQTQLSVIYLYPEPFSGGEAIIIGLRTPTPGIWTLTVYADSIVTGEYHIWISRKGFVNEATRFLRSDPNTTVQIPGTAASSIVVGAYDYVDDSVYVASGRGPTTDNIIKPDLIAPGVNVMGPTPEGGFTTYVGTSTAAAVTASACALLMQWAVIEGNFPNMNTQIARGILIRGARRQRGVTYPNNVEGYGRLDLQGSISAL